MKPEEALALLEQVIAQMNGSGQLHARLRQALDCLRGAISKPDVEEQPVAEQTESIDG